MPVSRALAWDGAYNARDLGGLPTTTGHRIRRGAVVRSASPAFMTEAGWSALWEHGVRTIVDLTNADERERMPDVADRPAGLTTLHLPLDPVDDPEFWGYWSQGLHGTPLYYRPYLDRYPERTARVVAAIAGAQPGGVLVHCSAGRDRTGLVTLVLLAFAGVSPTGIAADHALSHEGLRPMYAKLGIDDQEPMIRAVLEGQNTTADQVLLAALESLDMEAHLRAGGLTDEEVAALRTRLLEPAAG